MYQFCAKQEFKFQSASRRIYIYIVENVHYKISYYKNSISIGCSAWFNKFLDNIGVRYIHQTSYVWLFPRHVAYIFLLLQQGMFLSVIFTCI